MDASSAIRVGKCRTMGGGKPQLTKQRGGGSCDIRACKPAGGFLRYGAGCQEDDHCPVGRANRRRRGLLGQNPVEDQYEAVHGRGGLMEGIKE